MLRLSRAARIRATHHRRDEATQPDIMFKPVPRNISFPALETEITRFWQHHQVFARSLERRAGAERFVFYEGPPFANGLPGIHHLLARAFKDIILRYKTMKGFYVARKAGWDTHGLPTEMSAEKSLQIKSKKEI